MLTHAHAQSILQAAQDGRPVADNEWTALQRHLETCADCRAYAGGLDGLERGLSRRFKQDLSPRWAAAQPRDLSRGVIQRLQGEAMQRRMFGFAGAVGALVLLVGLLIGGGLLTPQPLHDSTTTPAVPVSTATPTLEPKLEDFYGGVAYEAERNGNREIYLLVNRNNGTTNNSEAENLTNNPANDTAPAWSPDGEWLAFLSDRTGKNEVYAMHVSGSRLTQLTDAPEIQWQGPLSWSHDGKLVAAMGVKILQPVPGDTGGQVQSSIYLIPTVRAGLPAGMAAGLPTHMSYVGGARYPRFSPTQPLIAYLGSTGLDTITSKDTILVYNIDQLSYTPATWFETTKEGMLTGANGEFDWSADGKALAYLSEDAQNTWVRSTTEINPSQQGMYYSNSNLYIGSQQRPGSVRAVSYGPEKNVAVYLQEQAQGDGCWRLTISRLSDSADWVSYGGLCVTGRLARANWTARADGNLLSSRVVVTGHRPGEVEDSIWAAALPGRNGGELILRRLGDAAGLVGTIILRPTLPNGERLAIDPAPAEPPAASLPPVEIPADLPGTLVMAPWMDNTSGGIIAERPDGSGRTVLGAAEGRDATCPSFSPDGKRIAFLSDRASPDKLVDEVFVMDADGSNVRQLTQPIYTVQQPSGLYDAKPLPAFSCPVWSPDGTMLAATVQTGKLAEVTLIPVDGTGEVQRTPIHQYTGNSPIWTPDSQSVLQYYWAEGASNPWITAISRKPGSAPDQQRLIEGQGAWFPVNMAFSPEGHTLAFLKLNIPDGERTTSEIVFYDYARDPDGIIHLDNPRTVYSEQGYSVNSFIQGELSWLPDGGLFFALVYPTNSHIKVKYMALDLKTKQAERIGQSEEVVFSAVLSPDGQWLAYDTETGLYLLNEQEALAGLSGPRRIGNDVILNMDWK